MNKYDLTAAKLAQDLYSHKWWFRFFGVLPLTYNKFYTEHNIYKKGKSIFLIGRSKKTVDLVICGSDNANDWLGKDGNFNVYLRPISRKGIKLSDGFFNSYEQDIEKIFIDAITGYMKGAGVSRIRIIGHSRGGGIAPIACYQIMQVLDKKVKYEVYCYNAPSSGNKEFYKYLKKKKVGLAYYRTAGDLVSRLPFKWLGYHRYPNTTVSVNKKGFPLPIKIIWPVLSHTPVYIISTLTKIWRRANAIR